MNYIFLNDRFEDIEAFAVIDILRRADIPLTTVGINKFDIVSRSGLTVKADIIDTELDFSDIDGIILPGGPGTKNLEKSEIMKKALRCSAEKGGLIAAICAAPSILGHEGLLKGRKATCFPGFENELYGALITDKSVVTDGNIITAKGAGVTVEFALEIVNYLLGENKMREIASEMQCERRTRN